MSYLRIQPETAKSLIAKLKQDEDHRLACDAQSSSKLLSLPREVRDRIWEEVLNGNIIHITRVPERPSKRQKTDRISIPKKPPKYTFHMCRSPLGLASSASPPGQHDHSTCSVTGKSDYPNLNLVCKQMYHELPDLTTTFFSQDALQFADLDTADEFLFGIEEDQRASISHLRIAVPYALTYMHTTYSSLDEKFSDVHKAWRGICNYFSNQWDRETVSSSPSLFLILRITIPFYARLHMKN
jgi:hypothetical protein